MAASVDHSETRVRPGLKAQLLRGGLAALVLPVPLVMIVGLFIDWHVTIPTAHSVSEAFFQAATYVPGSILVTPFVAILTFPAVGAWSILHWRGWANWYVCGVIGLATGWLNSLLWTSGIHGSDAFSMHLRWYCQTEFTAAGLLTGIAVWLVSRGRPVLGAS